MASEYRNIYVEDGGRSYRVAFHVGLGKVMIVARQGIGKRPRETAITIDGRRAKPIIEAARKQL